MNEPVLREPSEELVAFRHEILEILNEAISDIPAQWAVPAAEKLAERLAPKVCHCWTGGHGGYEGPQVDCPIHGVVAAYNELMRTSSMAARDYKAAEEGWSKLTARQMEENMNLRAQLVAVVNTIQGILDGTE